MVECITAQKQEIQRTHSNLNGVRYFCASGGLAELVDCTGLENRRAERYRGFESLSLRFKSACHNERFFCALE